MIFLFYSALCASVLLFNRTVEASNAMFFMVILATVSLFLATFFSSLVTRASISVYECLKIAMLSTIFLVLSVIFTFQVMHKSWLLMYSFLPLYFLSIFISIRTVSGVSYTAAAILTTVNIVALTLMPKLLGVILFGGT